MAPEYKFLSRLLELIILDRLLIRKEIRSRQTLVSGVMADIGSGRQPYRTEFRNISRYVSIDRNNANILHDLTNFPYPVAAESFNWILCTQVLDDFPDQTAFARELNRILTPGGALILTASFVWELHDLPHDYGRPSPESLRLLLDSNGFELVELKSLGNSWVTLGQVININLLSIMMRRSWWLKAISPFLLLNSLFFYGVGLLLPFHRFNNLPLALFLVARKK